MSGCGRRMTWERDTACDLWRKVGEGECDVILNDGWTIKGGNEIGGRGLYAMERWPG